VDRSRGIAYNAPIVRSPGWLLALTLTIVVTAPPAGATCDPPRCFDVVVPVPRRLRVPERTVRVLQPADYRASHARFPVLYLLHGAGDEFTSWTDHTDVQDFSASFPLIIVMPDGGHDAEAGFYSDWIDGSRDWETFHTRVLRRYVDRRFRTLAGRRHRAVAGLSMGGFGAMSYAARNPRLFRAAASFSGAVDTLFPDPAAPVLRTLNIVGLGAWGDPATNAAVWHAHNPTDLAAELRDVALFIATGNGQPGGPAGDIDGAPLAYATEAVVEIMSRHLVAALDAEGIPHTDDFYGGGYHGWPYWQRELHWLLPQLMTVIGPRRAR
jgi:S-formylglutathione hydrolase FrmB